MINVYKFAIAITSSMVGASVVLFFTSLHWSISAVALIGSIGLWGTVLLSWKQIDDHINKE